jgi:hypothetical protein
MVTEGSLPCSQHPATDPCAQPLESWAHPHEMFHFVFNNNNYYYYNYKAVPLYAMKALGGQEHSSYSFLTSALDEVSGQRHAPAAL